MIAKGTTQIAIHMLSEGKNTEFIKSLTCITNYLKISFSLKLLKVKKKTLENTLLDLESILS